MLTELNVKQIIPRAPKEWIQALIDTCQTSGISTPKEQAAFIAQLAHESDQFTRLEENLRYSSIDRIVQIFRSDYDKNKNKKIDPDEYEFAKTFVRNPEKLANYVYSNQNGNGSFESGDGWRYHGRGPIQITGKENYKACGEAIGMDLLTHPELLLTPCAGMKSAAWYWASRGLGKLAMADKFEEVTRRINGGLNGLQERRVYYSEALKVLA